MLNGVTMTKKHDSNKEAGENRENIEPTNDGAEKTVTTETKTGSHDERQELINHLQRLQAEFDNYRKRMSKEREDLVESSNDGLIIDLLPIIDNLDLAISHSGKDAENDELHKGVLMIRDQLDNLLSKYGVEKMGATGSFNPMKHEALLTESREGTTKGTILYAIQNGYVRKDKVLRPAKVCVAK